MLRTFSIFSPRVKHNPSSLHDKVLPLSIGVSRTEPRSLSAHTQDPTPQEHLRSGLYPKSQTRGFDSGCSAVNRSQTKPRVTAVHVGASVASSSRVTVRRSPESSGCTALPSPEHWLPDGWGTAGTAEHCVPANGWEWSFRTKCRRTQG